MPKLASHLGHLGAEVKARLDERLSLAPLRTFAAHLIDAVDPPADSDAQGLAAARWSGLRFLDGEGCEMCARPFADGLWRGAGGLCDGCTDQPFPFLRARAACLYDDASRDLVLAFKHGDRLDLVPMLSRWLEAGLDPMKTFILPGGSPAGAQLHVARTVARRAERALVRLEAEAPVEVSHLAYLNRLSDYLFVAARAVNAALGTPEPPLAL